jgi:hypothetical protein
MKMLISIVVSLLIVLTTTAVISYFMFMHDNRQSLEVYVDRDGQIYLNGVVSTEIRATSLLNDPAYISTLSYHPDSSVHYCFGQCR